MSASTVSPVEFGGRVLYPVGSTASNGRVKAAVAARDRRLAAWPVCLLAMPAAVAIWSGWVGLGELAGFGPVRPLPGIADSVRINTAVTLPIGMEAYAAYAMYVWLSGRCPKRARRFAGVSALVSLIVGFAGQAAYHLMAAAGVTAAPWPVVVGVSGVPVAVVGMGGALAHLIRSADEVPAESCAAQPATEESEPTAETRRASAEKPSAPKPPRGSRRSAGRSTAERVAAARRRSPAATQAEIAERLGIGVRTVGRYWAAGGESTGESNGRLGGNSNGRSDGRSKPATRETDENAASPREEGVR